MGKTLEEWVNIPRKEWDLWNKWKERVKWKSITKEALEELYLEKGLSDKQIGEHFGITKEPVRRKRIKFGIASKSITNRRNTTPDKTELKRLYIHQNLTDKAIAEIYGVTAPTIRNRRIQFGIKSIRRGRYEKIEPPSKEVLERLYITENLTDREIAKKFNVSNELVSKWRYNYEIKPVKKLRNATPRKSIYEPPSKEILEDLYFKLNLTGREIAKKYGVSRSLVYGTWFRNYGIVKPRTARPTKPNAEPKEPKQNVEPKEPKQNAERPPQVKPPQVKPPQVKPTQVQLRRMYFGQNLSIEEIAKQFINFGGSRRSLVY